MSCEKATENKQIKRKLNQFNNFRAYNKYQFLNRNSPFSLLEILGAKSSDADWNPKHEQKP